MGAKGFEWIHSSLDDQQYDAEKRRVVRAQAMRAVALSRRNTGTWGKQNMRQPAVIRYHNSNIGDGGTTSYNSSIDGQLRNSIRARDAWKSKDHVIPIIRYPESDGTPQKMRPSISAIALSRFEQCNGRLARPLPLPGFEYLSADVGINVLDLEELTCIATGQLAGSLLAQDISSLTKLMVRRRQSYLIHIPARHGHSTCLDDAMRCFAVKARRVLVSNHDPGGREAYLYGLYGKALCSLQAAVNDDDDWSNPCVLGAIEILSIFEVLESPGRSNAWESHIGGAGRLIKARGPSRFKTEFEKALLTSMCTPIICEAVRLREPCFLDEEPWQEVIASLVIENAPYYSSRGPSCVCLWAEGCRMPRFLLEMYRATADPESLTGEEIEDLETRCRAWKNSLLAWRRDYDAHLTIENPCNKVPPPSEGDVRIEILGSGLSLLATASRMISAISPSERVSEEAEAVRYSKHMRQIVNTVAKEDKLACFFLEQRIVVADSILSSTHMWLRGLEGEQPPKNRLIEKWKYQAWCNGIPDDYERQYDPRSGYSDVLPTWNHVPTSTIAA